MTLATAAIREQFPYLDRQSSEGGAYLDNAATTQTPLSVLTTMHAFMSRAHGNVHRGQHRETEISTIAYETARSTVQHFIGAAHNDEIIFTKNATEGINLVAHAWAAHMLQPGDCIALTLAEHHANSIPWLQLQDRVGIELLWIDVEDDGSLNENHMNDILRQGNVKLCAITGQSNVLGSRFDLPTIIGKAHSKGARVLIDAAQLVAHEQVDTAALGCDFLVFSGHKIYGPTGIGVLYASRDAQTDMIPFMGGGGMVKDVSLHGFTPADAPDRFEAGTPPITEAIGLAAAIEWQNQFSWKDRASHDRMLMEIAISELSRIEGLRFIGSGDPATTFGCLSFVIDGIHPHDLTDILGQRGIALRAGHHCAQPLHGAFGIAASTRLSTALYTTEEEILRCVEEIHNALKILR